MPKPFVPNPKEQDIRPVWLTRHQMLTISRAEHALRGTKMADTMRYIMDTWNGAESESA